MVFDDIDSWFVHTCAVSKDSHGCDSGYALTHFNV
jgi:hypothetical protein